MLTFIIVFSLGVELVAPSCFAPKAFRYCYPFLILFYLLDLQLTLKIIMTLEQCRFFTSNQKTRADIAK